VETTRKFGDIKKAVIQTCITHLRKMMINDQLRVQRTRWKSEWMLMIT